jgi:hypothetical protein
MAIPSVPANTLPANFKAWAEAVKTKLDTLPAPDNESDTIPAGAIAVYATTSQALADANPQFVWLVIA